MIATNEYVKTTVAHFCKKQLSQCKRIVLFYGIYKIELKKYLWSWFYDVPIWSDKTYDLLDPLPALQSIIFQIFSHTCLIGCAKKEGQRLKGKNRNLLFLTPTECCSNLTGKFSIFVVVKVILLTLFVACNIVTKVSSIKFVFLSSDFSSRISILTMFFYALEIIIV